MHCAAAAAAGYATLNVGQSCAPDPPAERWIVVYKSGLFAFRRHHRTLQNERKSYGQRPTVKRLKGILAGPGALSVNQNQSLRAEKKRPLRKTKQPPS